MDIPSRIKEARETLGLSQTAFGAPIGATRDAINNVEHGRAAVSNMLISIICREYNVNEIWLRTGEGEMFKQRTREDDIAAFFGQVLGGKRPDFQRRLIAVLARMTVEEWALLERKIDEIYAEMKNADN